MADEERLRPVVTNLVGNAAAHTPAGTAVRIGVGQGATFRIVLPAASG